MKKKIIWIIIGVILLLLCIGVIQYLRVLFAKIEVTLKEDLNVLVRSKVKWSDMIVSLNGTLLQDDFIDTMTLGEKNIEFSFKNDDGIKVKYAFTVTVVDKEAPIVWLGKLYTVNKGASESIFDKIMCADNYDENPICKVKGDYNLEEVGTYPVSFVATDSSGNQTIQDFTLKVQEPPKKSGNNGGSSGKRVYTDFQNVVSTYKREDTEIGLDISHWQGDVDYEKLKEAGVEFVILRVGTTNGMDGEFVLDKKFLQNIERANALDIPVGLYFYSYANSVEKAKEEANWLLEQIKDYKVELPIAFDWENWNSYNEFHLSLFGLSDMANAFLEVIENAGYEGMLYSSKAYLEQVWYKTEYKTWLAHYTNQTNYQGDYEFWQMCSDGAVNGILGDVDINIRYKK